MHAWKNSLSVLEMLLWLRQNALHPQINEGEVCLAPRFCSQFCGSEAGWHGRVAGRMRTAHTGVVERKQGKLGVGEEDKPFLIIP